MAPYRLRRPLKLSKRTLFDMSMLLLCLGLIIGVTVLTINWHGTRELLVQAKISSH